jgi:ribosome-associated translation inhibitor RaiA
MQVPLKVTFHGTDPSPAVEDRVRERAKKLERLCGNIIGCRVVIEAPHRHHQHGQIFHVRIDITIPQHEIVVSREPAQNAAHADVYVAIRDAFDAAERRLEDYVRLQRGEVKNHGPAV